ncbi:MAG: polysaccharide deacetylase family protein [Acidimicrobiia bacterium]
MEVRLSDFEWQLSWLQRHFELVDLPKALAARGSPASDRMAVLSFDDGYRDQFTVGFPVLHDLKIPFILYLTTRQVETGEPLGPASAAPLRWTELAEMAATGLMTVGAHTHSHPDLRLLDSAAVERELETSDELIRSRLGVDPHHFAYPWGYWSAIADPHIRKRYETATVGAGPPLTEASDHYTLSRIPIQLSDGRFFFRRKLEKGLRLEEAVRRRIKGYKPPPIIPTSFPPDGGTPPSDLG